MSSRGEPEPGTLTTCPHPEVLWRTRPFGESSCTLGPVLLHPVCCPTCGGKGGAQGGWGSQSSSSFRSVLGAAWEVEETPECETIPEKRISGSPRAKHWQSMLVTSLYHLEVFSSRWLLGLSLPVSWSPCCGQGAGTFGEVAPIGPLLLELSAW